MLLPLLLNNLLTTVGVTTSSGVRRLQQAQQARAYQSIDWQSSFEDIDKPEPDIVVAPVLSPLDAEIRDLMHKGEEIQAEGLESLTTLKTEQERRRLMLTMILLLEAA